jgi:hypothetical protein
MKKQILFLAFFTLALIFAGTNAFGQLSQGSADLPYLDALPTYCTPATTIDCGNGTDALAPIPGQSYEYTINSPTTTGAVRWFVTDEATLISAQGTIAATIEPSDGSGNYILTADGAYDNATNTSKTVNITWKAFDGNTNAVILVVYNVDDANCTDNMEVYRIIPTYNFSLDIAAIADDGANGGTVSDCVNPIQGATYDGTTLTVDYGTDYVFFAVNASNWNTSWMPDNFTVTTDPGTGPGGSTVTVTGWAYPDEAFGASSVWNTVGTDQVEASHYASNNFGFIASECIIVRVEVVHSTLDENIVAETINLTVNGEMINPQGAVYDGTYPDLEDGAGSACPDDLITDNADYTLTPRPAVTENTPTPFEDKTPNGN